MTRPRIRQPRKVAYSAIELEPQGAVTTLRFNRPGKLNAFNRELIDESLVALNSLAGDDRVRVVVLTGAGRCFSAGFDIAATPGSSKRRTVMEWKDHSRLSQEFGRRIWDFPKPVIASVRSYALGGACEIAMLCDLTIASEDAQFGEPEIRFGTGPPTLIMPWLVPLKVAKELLYSGKLIDARRALEIGMVNEVVPAADLERRTLEQARLIAEVAPLSVRLMKEALNQSFETMGLRIALAAGANLMAILDGTETESSKAFAKVRKAKGLKAALRWQEQRYRRTSEPV